jgi:histidyl-tRNA synthetase
MGMLTSISGYPEWLPGDRFVEQYFVNLIQKKFELFGFTPVETRAIEPLSTLASKGEVDKEIFTLRRYQATSQDELGDVGLHFDLTVPFARYTMENKSQLVFPFRRYQIQKVWRGERPGLGRYREFLQADIDIVDQNSLTISYDLEVIQTINEIMYSLPIPNTKIFVNNRKLLEGAYKSFGIAKIHETLRIIDKLAKIGERQVYQMLLNNLGFSPNTASRCIELGRVVTQNPLALEVAIKSLGCKNELIDEGLSELTYIMTACNKQDKNSVYVDLSIARGLDYYTGTVCEAKFVDFPKYPTIAAGGRYDNLLSDGSYQMPGVGISLGITRMLGLVLHENILRPSRKTPTCVLIALVSDDEREKSLEIANQLRTRGIPCETFPRAVKYGKQIKYAEKLGIPYVWFPSEDSQHTDEIRDIRNRTQVIANVEKWYPPTEDLSIQVVTNHEALEKIRTKSAYR